MGKRMKDGNVYAAGPQRYTGKVVANSTVMTPDGVVKGVLNGANVPAFEVVGAEVIIGRIMPSQETMACEFSAQPGNSRVDDCRRLQAAF